ncbi:unnamed protein product [Choristocarpus tenellus]
MSRSAQITVLCDNVERDLKLAGLPVDGSSTDGLEYSSLKQMWLSQLGLPRPATLVCACATCDLPVERDNGEGLPAQPARAGLASWYEKAYDYWEDGRNCGLNEDGVLGGYGHISPTDIAGSASFLDDLAKVRPNLGQEKAADCGAGIGRITKHLLLKRFDLVNLVEQSPRLLRAAPKYIGRERDRTECLCLGLQDFMPEQASYDLFWVQWVVGHFTDVDLLRFINRCRVALKPGGLIVIKDNVCGEGDRAFVLDNEDSSMTRSLGYFRSLFNHGGIKVVHEQSQEGFPSDIFPVHMFALE